MCIRDSSFSVVAPELGPGVESLIAWFQPISIDPQGKKLLGTPSAMLVLDQSF